MADVRFLKPGKTSIIFFDSYEVDTSIKGGFSVKLNWSVPFDPNIVGYRIYKSNSKKPLLKETYILSQKFFEKTTANLQKKAISNILYTKSFASENSKVEFFQSELNRFKKPNEAFPDKSNYKKIAFIKQNKKSPIYQFVDNSVIFGETYNYLLTAFDKNLQESAISVALTVNVEDLEPASAIKNTTVQELNNGILFIINLQKSEDIMGFDFFRKNTKTGQYEFLYHLKNDRKTNNFLDSSVIPGNVYEYKIFSVDFFGRRSYESLYKRVIYKSIKLKTGGIPDPIVDIFIQNNFVKIIGFKNDENVIGYRIERQDLWKYETGFSLKQYNFIPWNNCILFNTNDQLEFSDFAVTKDRIYKYRISSILKNTSVGSYFVSPPIRVNELEKSIISDEHLVHEDKISILNFGAEIIDRKQNPIFIKFTWKIDGNWDQIKLSFSDGKEQIVDRLHDFIYFSGLKKGQYKIKLQPFNKDRNLIENVSKEISINI